MSLTDGAQPLEMLLVGDADQLEFRAARRQMDATADVTAVDDVAAAIEHIRASACPPDLLVVAQRQPAEFSAAQLNALQAAAPLARIVMLLGSWCEGELRTGDPWPAAVRVYWYRWPAFFADELSRLYGDRQMLWCLPLTTSDEERTMLAAGEPVARRSGLIATAAGDEQTASWLADACSARGYATVWLSADRPPRASGACAIVCDLPRSDAANMEQLAALATCWAPAPVVALLNNPRFDERQQALDAGAREVIAKPLELSDLYWALDQVTGESAEDSSSSSTVIWQRRISRRQAGS